MNNTDAESRKSVLEGVWRKCLLRVVNDTESNVFDNFLRHFEDHYKGEKATNIKEMKWKAYANYRKGIEFEEMCVELLKRGALLSDWQPEEVYRFPDLTDAQKMELRLVKNNKPLKVDMGIDLVGKDKRGHWQCFQVKYVGMPRNARTPWRLSHQALTTFNGVVWTTGPLPDRWNSHVVLTTAKSICRIGDKSHKDVSVCNGTFRAISIEVWKSLLGDFGHVIEKPLTPLMCVDASTTTQTITPVRITKNRKVNATTLRSARSALLDRVESGVVNDFPPSVESVTPSVAKSNTSALREARLRALALTLESKQ